MRRPRTARLGTTGRPGLAAAGVATALIAMAAAPTAFAGPTPRAASAAAAVTSPNLIVDPGGESAAECSATGLDGQTVPGWTITGGMPDVVCYGASGGFPDANTPGSPTRGKGFFEGGGTGSSSLRQVVDVSGASSAIDAGGVPYNLSGWLGGYSSQGDMVGLTATFQNAAGATVGSTVQLGPVTPANRGNVTEFLNKTATGSLPAGTRSVKLDLAFTYASGDSLDGYADDLSLTIGASLPAPTLTAPTSTVPGYDHVFMVYMENENYEAIIGNSAAPYINSLMPAGTTLTQSYATTHPSDPNYVAFAGGALYGVYGNSITTSTINAPHIGNSVENAGKTWKAYSDNMNGNCNIVRSQGSFSPDDVPFYYFANMKNNASYCQSHWQPLTTMKTDLQTISSTPNYVWFSADDCQDMEGCGIASGDTWLKNTLPSIFNSPAWTQQKSLLILTWDEGTTKAYGPNYPNRVPTILLGSQNTVKTNYLSSQRTDQYGLLRLTDQALGLAPLTNNDKYAATVNDAWGSSGGGGGGGGPIVSGGVYTVALPGGQVVDDPGSSTSTGTQMIVYPPNSPVSSNQKWTFTGNSDGSYTVKNGASGLCLDDSGASNAAGAQIIQWTCGSAANQHWSIVAKGSSYELVSKQSGLSVTAAGTANSSVLTQQADTGGALQTWTFTKVG